LVKFASIAASVRTGWSSSTPTSDHAAVVPLSSVRHPRDQLGRAAAQMLFEEIRDGQEHRHRQVVFEPELVVRESSSRPA
jgi:DNA-binding LacI/PurR family transcriptional regulator